MSDKQVEVGDLFKDFVGSPTGSTQSKALSTVTEMTEDISSFTVLSEEQLIKPTEPPKFELPVIEGLIKEFDEAEFLQKLQQQKRKGKLKESESVLDELSRLCVENQPLFRTIVADTSGSMASVSAASTTTMDTSFLITGFGLRNLKSLEDALRKEDRKKLRELFYRMKYLECHKGDKAEEEYEGSKLDVSSETSGTTPMMTDSKRRLEYLMGITQEPGEEEGPEERGLEEIAMEEMDYEPALTGTTQAMRQAQKYLRCHKIFEFFQFIIAHMLSNLPENPIRFIVDLLDKCLMYRSGFGEPPLLYNKQHAEQLFFLMDPMRTGFIEPHQYVTGMTTLGLCSYNKTPPLSLDGMVSKEFFVEEAYECGINLLNDMIRRRWMGKPPPVTPPPPPTPQFPYSAGASSVENRTFASSTTARKLLESKLHL